MRPANHQHMGSMPAQSAPSPLWCGIVGGVRLFKVPNGPGYAHHCICLWYGSPNYKGRGTATHATERQDGAGAKYLLNRLATVSTVSPGVAEIVKLPRLGSDE